MMENNKIGRWPKTLRALRKFYHSMNNLWVRAKDQDFNEFRSLDYAKSIPEELKDPKQLQFLKQLELAKQGYVNKELKTLINAAKQRERLKNHDHKTIPIGNIRVIEGESLLAMVRLGFDPVSETFCVAYRHHENIPVWKTYDSSKLQQYFGAFHPQTTNALELAHLFFDNHTSKTSDENKVAMSRFYNKVVKQSFESNTYFENNISLPDGHLLLSPENQLGKQFYLPLGEGGKSIMSLTEANERYFVFQSFLDTAPKPESIYFERQEFKERFLDSGITLLAHLKHGLRLGVQNGVLQIGKFDGANGSARLRWETFESRLHSSSLSALEKFYLSKEVISKKNFLVETDAISLKSDTKKASLKKHYGTGQWYLLEAENKQNQLNYRPVDHTVLKYIQQAYPHSPDLRSILGKLQNTISRKTVQIKPLGE